ncbi:MAG TPA: sialidase family protein [Candidatus Hydrogenedentes bacterium]|nr:sialidase family protein [Candidatus Hydrogenedentota bacterium]HOV74954.1 sialidase family protein [Candidatus Hydrogenedentota bacterium]
MIVLYKEPLRKFFIMLPAAIVAFIAFVDSSFGENEGMKRIVLFKSGKGGYDTYRIPAIVKTTKGTLLAFCEGRKNSSSDTGNIDLLLQRSLDNGFTWDETKVIVDDGNDTCGNPCPIVDQKTGTLVLLLTKNKGHENEFQIINGTASPRTVWLTRSTDDGVTWSTPSNISSEVCKPDFRWYATGPCHGIQLAGGRMVAPCDHSTGPAFDDMHSHVIFSDDGGMSWQIGGILDSRTNECTAVQLADGSLYLNMRNYRNTNRRAVSVSSDNGMTWQSCRDDEALLDPVCQASVLRFSIEKDDGKNRVLFSNPASKKRENMTVRLSYDECRTWPVSKSLWNGPSAYSDLVVTADGKIGCLFECGVTKPYETITLALFSLEWLTGGADSP